MRSFTTKVFMVTIFIHWTIIFNDKAILKSYTHDVLLKKKKKSVQTEDSKVIDCKFSALKIKLSPVGGRSFLLCMANYPPTAAGQ